MQYFISLCILGCPDILVYISRRGSSSITRMCVYLSGFENSWMLIMTCTIVTSSELQLDSVQYYPHIVQYCMILVKFG